MKKILFSLVIVIIVHCTMHINNCFGQKVQNHEDSTNANSPASNKNKVFVSKGISQTNKNGPVISNLTYDSIIQTRLILYWTTDFPADSKIKWMAPDSNYQPLIFTDSLYEPAAVTNHVLTVSNLQPATIYKYHVISQNMGGTTVDSGYFVTQSASTGKVDVYFNHTVDTTVSTGEYAKGSCNFANLFVNQINSAQFSIDITLWEFSYYTAITDALINAKNRGVKIRFVYNHTNTPWIDTLIAHGIPIQKRNYDTTFSMHNKFLIFDYRYNPNPNNKYLWTGSTNVSHPQFHSDKNNIIIVQDESLCAVYTREFEEMWGSHTDMPDASRARFGDQKTNNVPHILNVAGKRMEVYFSPSDSIVAFLSNLILTKTKQSLFFCMLKFDLPEIENTLHTIFNSGKQLKGVFDLSDSFLPNSAYPRMSGLDVVNTWDPHADVFVDSIPGLIHHKYFIIDANAPAGNKIISTGSFNWETPAETGNDENSLTLFDARVNNLYFQEFHQRYRESGGETIEPNFIPEEVSSGFSLSQNWPNPFNPVTRIKFNVTELSPIKLTVYDIMGREIQTLVNETLNPGLYESSFDGSSLNRGIYLYKISTGHYSETKRMILIK